MDLERLKSEACLAWSVHTMLDEERESQLFMNSRKACVSLKNTKVPLISTGKMCQALKASINNSGKYEKRGKNRLIKILALYLGFIWK